jgi:chromosome segregation ATPase
MDTSWHIIALVTGALGFVGAAIMAVLGWFARTAFEDLKEDHDELKKELKEKTNAFYVELKERDAKYEKMRENYESKLEGFQRGLGARFDDALRAIHAHSERPSQHDIELSHDALRDLRNQLRDLEKELNKLRVECTSTYITKMDFARDSAALEARIASTKRAVETVDSVLREYLHER